jgi:hypothetical protein
MRLGAVPALRADSATLRLRVLVSSPTFTSVKGVSE